MISNGMWEIFSLPDPHNLEKNWDLLLNQSRIPLDSVKHHTKIPKEVIMQINILFRT